MQRDDYESSGVTLQLDLHRNMVVYTDFDTPPMDYLEILKWDTT